MKDWVFSCLAPPGVGAQEAVLLARSIRQFAGGMADNQIWVWVPEAGKEFEPVVEAAFKSLAVHLIPFSISEDALAFPFAAKVFAAAAAESRAEAVSANLIWMDRDTIVVQQPDALRLEQDKVLGYRPVDHTLIGSPFDDPLDDFWRLVYRLCAVPVERVFPMIASVDEKKIRPYFNAGMLVVRPEKQLLRSWADNFNRLYKLPVFDPFYKKDTLYQIFIHQAILASTILAACDRAALQPLPHLVNYPLHMHRDYPADRRPTRMNDMISCRYDTFFKDPAWEKDVVIDEPLIGWLREQGIL